MKMMKTAIVAMLACATVATSVRADPKPKPPDEAVPGLRIGHFRSKDGAVGAVIEKLEKSARIKLDGSKDFIALDRGSVLNDRTDYLRTAAHVMLQLYKDGHAVVFLQGQSDGIALERDGNVDASGKVTLTEPAKPDAATRPTKDQSVETKLKLGHFANAKLGVGAIVDRTGHEAKLRFDGSKDVFKLDPSPGPDGRTDYMKNAHQIMLQVWQDGRVTVYVPGAHDDGIELKRDGDADPL